LKTDETPSENAQRFFTRYRKLVNSAKVVKKEIHKTIHEINYLRNLLQQIDTAHESGIEEIRDELKEEGYLKKQKQRKRKKNQKKKKIIIKNKKKKNAKKRKYQNLMNINLKIQQLS